MSDNGNSKNGWRTQPMYSFSEAAHLAHVSVSTVRNWLLGYFTERGEVKPLFNGNFEEEKACSFLQLIEIVVAAKFRKAEHVKLSRVRDAYDNAKKFFRFEYPFASVELKGIGGHIVHVIRVPGISLQSLDVLEQFTLPGLVQETIEQIEYEGDLANRWYPIGKDIPIVVDPQISAGLPVIDGRGITVEAIYKRFKANQEIAYIEKDYKLEHGIVEKAIRFREQVTV